MLLLLLFVNSLFKNGITEPLPNSPQNDTCDDINNCRKLFDIVWDCLAPIFACTWVSVHQNVPPPGQGRLALFRRRLKMMLAAVLAPELIVGFAARQFLIARRFSKGKLIFTRDLMVLFHIPFIWEDDVEEIIDKSKGDALSKGLAIVRGLWFTVQCLARVHQHLAVTTGSSDAAFAVVNAFIWVLWWDKPLDIQRPIVVGPPKTSSAEEVPRIDLNGWTRLASACPRSGQGEHEQRSSASGVLFEQLVAIIFAAIHCTAWKSGFPTAEEAWIWRTSSLSVTAVPVIFFAVGAAIILTKAKLSSFDPYVFTCIALILVYIFARIFLITLPLVALRELPPSAFVDVNWSLYIPHL
ncbi:hypothetical protein MVEN_02112000 [Mycena venus]|uniref:Uncharacterized protein n=1 Tax=Mycena venus TaxID=2733690 RepID=A0A8H6X8W0_9AGAR|nr:hypothetical protein MVEN_02112000 [Mycena venus]